MKIKCVDCGHEFTLINDDGGIIQFCPFCGGEAIGEAVDSCEAIEAPALPVV